MYKVFKYTISATLLIFLASTLRGESPQKGVRLSLQECITQAVESNFSILIEANRLEVERNNLNLEPYLPQISASSQLSDLNGQRRDWSSPDEMEQSSSRTTSLSAGVNLNWRLFDGFSMFATRERERELLHEGEFNFKMKSERLVMSVYSQFYQIITLHNQLELLKEVLSISQIRYNQALTRYNIGSDSGLEYKQAKIYLNSDSSSLMLQQERLKNAYIELYRLMNIPLDSKHFLKDTIIPDRALQFGPLLESAIVNNTELNALRVGERLSDIDMKMVNSQRYPTLDFIAGYNLNYNRSALFPSKFNELDGFNWGFSLSVPLFRGGEINRKARNAKLMKENSKLLLQEGQQQIESDLRQLYNLYLNNLRSIEFEEESRESAFLNLEAAMEKYRLGALAGIEFRDYQISYLSASDRKLKALYDAKLSEIELKLLAGELLQHSITTQK